MSAKNNITGDNIATKALSKQGRDNWDNIFRKKTHETTTEHAYTYDTATTQQQPQHRKSNDKR